MNFVKYYCSKLFEFIGWTREQPEHLLNNDQNNFIELNNINNEPDLERIPFNDAEESIVIQENNPINTVPIVVEHELRPELSVSNFRTPSLEVVNTDRYQAPKPWYLESSEDSREIVLNRNTPLTNPTMIETHNPLSHATVSNFGMRTPGSNHIENNDDLYDIPSGDVTPNPLRIGPQTMIETHNPLSHATVSNFGMRTPGSNHIENPLRIDLQNQVSLNTPESADIIPNLILPHDEDPHEMWNQAVNDYLENEEEESKGSYKFNMFDHGSSL